MAVYRTISLSFWDDNKVVDDFTPEDRYFYLYLLTNPHTNLIGCYEVSLKQMSNETGYNIETIEKLIDRMQNVHGVIMYSKDTKEVLIKRWSRYNWTRSDKLLKNVENVSKYVKNDELKNELSKIVENYKKNAKFPESKGKTGYPMYTSIQKQNVSVSVSVSDTVLKELKNNKNLIELFNEYLELRSKNKLSNSETVIKSLLEFLKDKTDNQKEKIIKKAIMNNWKDFYPVEDDKRGEINYETV